MQIKRFLVMALAALVLVGCVPSDAAQIGLAPSHSPRPAMGWDHRPEAGEWTERILAAIATRDDVLAHRLPADIAAWCPGYAANALPERRAFWAGMVSAVAKYESSWNPQAAGGGGRWIGVMQISPKTAANYGCSAHSAKALKDGAANLECAVAILARQVSRDGVVAGKGNRGIGRDWGALHKSANRAEISAWIGQQSYCR